eukprot:TRINITY_DN17390_c0_g1_i1.p1 TRINITY_DN17390_c0_g1~~TRINITY_DN17390_c0_g1_i1.p1  ORF type:complete len:261 (-),score=12.74 TRINITY_DN17390_c0_g1_i1:80-862(-)
MRHNHHKYKIFIIILLIFVVLFSSLYFEFWWRRRIFVLQLIFKPMPVFFMIIFTIIYMIEYDRHNYSLLILIGLLFFIMGDVLLLFSESIYFLLGMGSFLIGRVFMTIAFSVKPFRRERMKRALKWRGWYVLCLLFFAAAGYMAFLFEEKLLRKDSFPYKISIPIYVFICALQISFSFFRFSVVQESALSKFLGFLGSFLIGISDGFLGYSMFVSPLISHGRNINAPLIMTTYWAGNFLITISILRDWSENSKDSFSFFL